MPRQVSLTIVDKLGAQWEPGDAGNPERLQFTVVVRDSGGEIRQNKTAVFWKVAPTDGTGQPITEQQEGHFLMGPAMEAALAALLDSADRRLARFVAPKDSPPATHRLDKPEEPKAKAQGLSPQARAAATRKAKAAKQKAQEEQAPESTEEAS